MRTVDSTNDDKPPLKQKPRKRNHRNKFAYELLDRKGPYAIKIVNPKRGGPYDRQKFKKEVNEIPIEEQDYDGE